MATNRISVLIDVVSDKATRGVQSFQKSIKDADGAVGKFKAGSASAFSAVKANAAEFALVAGAALVSYGAKAVASFTQGALAAGQFADATGLSTEQASKWISVADDFGLSADTLQRAFLRLNKELGEGSATAEAYGISVQRTADGQVDTNATMLEAIEIIGGIEDPTKRAAVAQELFGRSYAEVAEIILGDADKINDALESTSEAQVFDEDEVRKAREYRAAMDELGDVMTDVSNQVGEILTPVITDAAQTIKDLTNIVEGGAEAGEKFGISLEDVERGITTALNPLGNYAGMVYDAAEAAGVLGDANQEAADDVKNYTFSADEALDPTRSLAEQTNVLAGETDGVSTALRNATIAIDKNREALDKLIERQEAAKGAQMGVVGARVADQEANDGLIGSLLTLIDAQGDGNELDQERIGMAQTLVSDMDRKAQAAANLAEQEAIAAGAAFDSDDKHRVYQDTLNELRDGTLPQLTGKVRDYVAEMTTVPKYVGTTFNTNFTSSGFFDVLQKRQQLKAPPGVIPHGATGGIVTRPTVALIGEAGPEAVIPLNKTPGSSPLPAGGMGGGPTIYLTVNSLDANAAGRQIVDALNAYYRNGGRPPNG